MATVLEGLVEWPYRTRFTCDTCDSKFVLEPTDGVEYYTSDWGYPCVRVTCPFCGRKTTEAKPLTKKDPTPRKKFLGIL